MRDHGAGSGGVALVLSPCWGESRLSLTLSNPPVSHAVPPPGPPEPPPTANPLGTHWILLVLAAPWHRDVTGTGTNSRETEPKSLWLGWHLPSMESGGSETPRRGCSPPPAQQIPHRIRDPSGNGPCISLGPHTGTGGPFQGDPAGEGAHVLSVPPPSSSALRAISKAPSRVQFPPMKPLAWTKTQPGIPASSDSASSRSPRQASGRGSLWGNRAG